jgi:antirestriction protein ArdC
LGASFNGGARVWTRTTLPKIETHEHDPIEAAGRIITGMPNPPEIQHAGSKAFYSPITDVLQLWRGWLVV